MTREEFEELVAEALDRIPPELTRLMDNVAVFVEDEPPSDDPELLGLYEGTPLTDRGEWYAGVLPDRITIYRGPTLRMCDDPRGRGRGDRGDGRPRDRPPLRHRRRAAARARLRMSGLGPGGARTAGLSSAGCCRAGLRGGPGGPVLRAGVRPARSEARPARSAGPVRVLRWGAGQLGTASGRSPALRTEVPPTPMPGRPLAPRTDTVPRRRPTPPRPRRAPRRPARSAPGAVDPVVAVSALALALGGCMSVSDAGSRDPRRTARHAEGRPAPAG